MRQQGLEFEPYHGGMDDERRRELEAQLMANEVDGLAATNALGMGFNKPDLGWVIHFQRPPNLIRYYQEIGRAGRDLDGAFAVLLSGDEDNQIAEYFIEEAFPDPEEFEIVLSTLADSEESLYKYQLLKQANISWKAASQCLDMLRVDNAVIRVEDGFERTATDWDYDHDRIASVTQQRRRELERTKQFVQTDDCLTRFIDDELDGSLEEDCGRCGSCMGPFLPTDVQDEGLVSAAIEHYRAESATEISPRYYMSDENGRSKIAEKRKPEPGRALAVYGDPGYGALVSQQFDQDDEYSQKLVDGAVEYIKQEWTPSPSPTWVTAVPSPTGEKKVQDLAKGIATGLGIEYVHAVEQVELMQPQHELANSYQKRWNVKEAFATTDAIRAEPVLLIDDTVESRWSFTEAALMLCDAGSGQVYPFALAERSRW